MTTDLRPGASLGGCRIKRLIGRGGMGVVYLAEQVGLGRDVALKVIVPEVSQDLGFRQRFEREAQTAASLDHPNIVTVHEAGEDQGQLFLVMRYIDGPDLRQCIASEGALAPQLAVSVVSQVASALDAAHGDGLVHRDIKPANVLLARREHGVAAYLSDFGLTKHMSSMSGLTQTGNWVGTADYIAPEQIQGDRVDARTDVYALGCVLHEALTGWVPYPRDSDMAKMWAHVNTPPPRPTERRGDVSPEFDEVVQRALAKNPDQRFPSAGDLARAAQAALENRAAIEPERTVAIGQAAPMPATTAGTVPIAPALPANGRTIVEPIHGSPRLSPAGDGGGSRRRRPAALIAIVAVVFVLLLGGGAAALVSAGGSRSKTASTGTATTTTPTTDTGTTDTTTTDTTPADTTPTDTAPTGTPPTPSGPDAGAVDAVNSYWRAINNSDFHQAFTYLADAGESESDWVSGHEAEGIQSASFSGSASGVTDSTATVNVDSLQTRDQKDGCQTWSGHYEMVNESGTWLIDKAKISPSAC